MVGYPLSWETETTLQADWWPAGDRGYIMRAVASAEPDLDGRLCVTGVVAGTAELQDAVFTHRRLIGFDGRVDGR